MKQIFNLELSIFNSSKGQTMIISIIFFLSLSLVAVFGIINPVIRHANATRSVLGSKQGFYLAEAGMEDIVYRLKNGLQTSASNSLSLDGENVITSIADTSSGKTLISTGESKDFIRKLEVNLITGIGIAFNYGIQTGVGGFHLLNNAGVNGNVYANGPIVGSNGAFVTGSAFSANSSASAVDQDNSLPATPPNQIIFGNGNGTQDVAQSFTVSTVAPLGKVAFYIKKVSTPANITVRLVNDASGVPGNTTISSITLSASLVTSNFGWVEVPITTTFDLSPGATYWIVLDAATSATKYYTLAANNSYALGVAKIGRHTVSWGNTTPSGLDGYFKIYTGGFNGNIYNLRVGTSGMGDAKAHEINDSNITGNLYCQIGSSNNKPCNTSQADPTPIPYPVSEANIDDWKSEAESDNVIINNNVALSDGSSSMGPTKIVGNLTIDNNYTLTITGTIWVTGNINLSNNVVVRLSPGYGASSGTIVSDGRVSLSNNVIFQGSGQPGSYVMLLTTSDCPNNPSCSGAPAIDIGNNAGTVLLNAQQGTIQFSNNAGAKEATANLISLDNNATVTYETGLADVNFSSGPSGGFDVVSWKEVE